MGLGLILRNLRTSYHYSQKYVADRLGISRNAYMSWENGKTQLNLKKLNKISEVYQISLQKILIPKLTPVPAKRTRKKRKVVKIRERELTV